ncbi:MAG: hypothetical protein V4631_09310 [Pseudomonadota bacterium]
MNGKYFAYAIVLTLVTTLINWGSMIGSSSSSSGRGSSWSSQSSGGGFGGGGHK